VAKKKTAKKKTAEKPTAFVPAGTTVASDAHWDCEVLATGIPSLDHILGGGLGCKRIAEIFGPPGCGKSAIGYYLLSRTVKQGGVAILSDNEGAFNRLFYKGLGGDPDKLFIADEFVTATVEELFDFLRKTIEEYGKLGPDVPPMFILWDSIAATCTLHLQEAEPGKRDLSKSTAMSAGLQKIMPFVRSANVCVLGINQTIQNINKRGGPSYTTPGGDRWKFLSSQRIDMWYSTAHHINVDDQHVGQRVSVKIPKSRMGSPQQSASLYFYTVAGAQHPVYKDRLTPFGFDVEQSLWDYYLNGDFFYDDEGRDVTSRVVQANGSWYKLHPSIEPDNKSFHATDWLEKLDKYPHLKTLLYDDLEIDPNTVTL